MRQVLLLPLGALAAAIATTIQVTLHFLKGDHPEPSITAYSHDRSQVVGHSCSTSLTLENSVVAFDVDQNGAGSITLDEEEYKVHDDPEISGGVICGRIHNDAETVVNCELVVPDALDLHPLNRRNLPECKSMRLANNGGAVLEGFLRGPEFLPSEQLIKLSEKTTTVVPRQCGIQQRDAYRAGNGNPHQNPLNIQLSEPMQCGSRDGCEVNWATSRSITIGWSASATAWQWLNGGFAVDMSIDTGNSYTCPGRANDYFALWKNQAQTAYTVRNRLRVSCGLIQDVGGNYVMWSPNKNNRGGYYYCVYGRQYVRWLGDRWLDTSPNRPGGPP
ncbi:hypothetical protein B0I35DRAFT_491514 [Stachybotrys elegans]|uniref:Uncharacterized protein n=1 Tax=Stachybotrys elegans TaxID=80388 RepID=A0A8K0SLW6_9HYPO|nr:hypothetical protein B0I35DRAFT_491514 [Stachybotrys elegans]